jgi:deaminated glutathione amidase
MKIAAVQMNSGEDKEANLRTAETLIDAAAKDGARVVALPETFNYMGPIDGSIANAESLDGPTITRLAAKARGHGIYLLCGSIQERSEQPRKTYNTSVLLNPRGEIIAAYRKIHLFDVEITGMKPVRESAVNLAGAEVITADIDGVTVGLTICYDVRFPELYRSLMERGATLVFVPAAFKMLTGKDHWKTLLQARAIENQFYIAAPGQIGRSHPEVLTYGRSLIADPWGLVLAQAPDIETFITAELDFNLLEKVRRELPALTHRRPEVYT